MAELKKILILFSIFSAFGIPLLAFAGDYYADIIITVDSAGNTGISGLTNHMALQGSFRNYTSKSGSIWLLNISPEGNFSDFLYEIRLPENSAISYIKVPGRLSIENLGYLSITGSGKNSELSLIVQYEIKPAKQPFAEYAIIILTVLVLVSAFFIAFRRAKNVKSVMKINKDSLTERENRIVILLEKNPSGMAQSRLQKELNLPKASLSRNLRALAKKGIIIKSEKGMTNYISLKKN